MLDSLFAIENHAINILGEEKLDVKNDRQLFATASSFAIPGSICPKTQQCQYPLCRYCQLYPPL